MLDDEPQGVRYRAIQRQPPRHTLGQAGADRGMMAMAVVFAHVVEQKREVQHERPVEALKQWSISEVRRGLLLPHPAPIFQAEHGGVLRRGFLIKKLLP